jgi:DNA polymerase-1
MSNDNTIVLVDGSSLAFRSFYAMFTSDLRTSDNIPTGAIYGFFNSLFDLIEKRSPHSIAVCFDMAEPTFRHIEYEDYKAHRSEMPDDLSIQWPIIKEGVKLLDIPVYELPGWEADDIIGTVAKQAKNKNLKVLILTGDQDAFQLLDGNIEVLMPSKEGLKTYRREEVFEKLGVWPEQVIDYKGLCGDSSDNIPGVRGIGPKTAQQLLTQYKTMEGIYEHLSEISSKSVKTKLTDGEKSAFASKDLATIRLDVPLDFDFDHCQLSLPDIPKVANFFQNMESRGILRRLPKVLAKFNNGKPIEIDDALLSVTPKAKIQAQAQKPKDTEETLQLSLSTTALATKPKVIRIIQTESELDLLVKEISDKSALAVHIECDSTSSLNSQIVSYAFAWTDEAKYENNIFSIATNKKLEVNTAYIPLWTNENQLNDIQATKALKPILENNAIGKICYNAKFTMNVLSLKDIVLSPVVFDPMLASYIINPDENHKLTELAQNVLGYSLSSMAELRGTGRKQIASTLLSIDQVAPIAIDEAKIVLELTRHYNSIFDNDQRDLLFDMDLPLCTVLAQMEQTGVKLDVPYFEKLANQLNIELARLEKEIYDYAKHSFNINSPLQLQKVLFEELKLPTRGKTKTGYSTDASVLESLIDEHPIITKILEYRHIAKLSSTYVDALPQQISPRDDRLHGEFNQTITATGRLSSTNPNLQNIPIRTELGRSIRKGFIPSSNKHVLLSADYSQIELRLLAHMSGDEKLIEAFQNDEDVHTRTAMEIFDVKEKEVTADLRRVGKTLNFALIYQQGAFSTAKDLGVSTKEAQVFIDKYFNKYPKVRKFLTGIIEEARKNGYVQTLWGRRRYFKHLNDRNEGIKKAEERAACNAPLQGSAADLIKLAMIRLDKELKAQKLSAKLILQVHDELVFDVPKDELEQTKDIVKEAMSLDQPLKAPLRVDIGVGPNWMDTK